MTVTLHELKGKVETGIKQVIDVFDEPPTPGRSGGGTKIVFRKPIEKERSKTKANV